MLRIDPFIFCCNIIPGNDPEVALDVAKDFGFKNVELPMIDGMSEQFDANLVTPEYCAKARKMLEQRDLTCISVSGHCSMTEDAQFERLLKKIRFAGEVGAKFLNTRCGPKEKYGIFIERIKRAFELADSLGVQLNLESYGDIVGPASEAGAVFSDLHSKGINVKYIYDNGNTYRFKRGQIVIEDDLKNATVPISYVHLKNHKIVDGVMYNTAIGAGEINIPAMFEVLANKTPSLPVALEATTSFSTNMSDLSLNLLSPTVKEAIKVAEESVEYVKSIAKVEY